MALIDATGIKGALAALEGTYEVKVGVGFLNTGDIIFFWGVVFSGLTACVVLLRSIAQQIGRAAFESDNFGHRASCYLGRAKRGGRILVSNPEMWVNFLGRCWVYASLASVVEEHSVL